MTILKSAVSANKTFDEAVDELIRISLEEDVGTGDVTSLSTISPDAVGKASFLAKADGVVAGLRVVEKVFKQVDASVKVEWSVEDGAHVKKGDYFGTVSGTAYSIIVGERLALNLIQRMSGIASFTNRMVSKIPEDSKTRVLDTRKTVPGLRHVDKAAVKLGGGVNHRFALYDMVMIKDNHISAAGGIKEAVARTLKWLEENRKGQDIKVEVETRTLDEVKIALDTKGIDRVMLDNMVKVEDGKVDTSMLEKALALIQGKIETEASGNVNMDTITEIGRTNVDYVSVGALTHSVTALDISLKITEMK